ncbi:DUF1284 domain-containing protein [Rhizobium helianthi]|uniref:DUF1284 domain-containing protein n=1 Tax=Rhizobium helianthi TaxID=1132695 RepID=A0ABW4M3R7_9HYPH
MTIRLRPHHLLCMLTFVGKGYTPSFTQNYVVIIRRLGQGEDILLVDGPDDICAPLLADIAIPHCHSDSVASRDTQALLDIACLLGVPHRLGDFIRLNADLLRRLRTAFAMKQVRNACQGCEWAGLCDSVAHHDFQDALLRIE